MVVGGEKEGVDGFRLEKGACYIDSVTWARVRVPHSHSHSVTIGSGRRIVRSSFLKGP